MNGGGVYGTERGEDGGGECESCDTSDRRVAREEGLFAGTSSGANVVAAIRVGERLGEGARVVTLMADSGSKYLSTSLTRWTIWTGVSTWSVRGLTTPRPSSFPLRYSRNTSTSPARGVAISSTSWLTCFPAST